MAEVDVREIEQPAFDVGFEISTKTFQEILDEALDAP